MKHYFIKYKTNTKKKRQWLLLLLLLCFAVLTKGQNPAKAAENLYDEGKIEKIPAITRKKIEREDYREQERATKRLTILSYIYNDDSHKADSAMLELLQFEKEYKLMKEDSATEFQYLYETYRTSPVYSAGLIGGFNCSQVSISNAFGVNNVNKNKGKYTSEGLGFQVGLSFSVYLDFILQGLQAYADVVFQKNQFKYTNKLYDFSRLEITETQTWINPSFSLSYSINLGKQKSYFDAGKFKRIKPFVLAGITPSFLLTDYCKPFREYDGFRDIKSAKIGLEKLRNRVNFAVHAGVGVKVKFPMSYLFFDVRYYKGFFNQVNRKNRYSIPELIYNYYYIDNDFKLNNFSFRLGYRYLIYRPKKKKYSNK